MLGQSFFKAYKRLNWLICQILVKIIACYQYLISPLLGNRCRFYPSCSVYCQQALLQLGFFKGLAFTLWRLLRCGPWHSGGYDPPPPSTKHIDN